MNLYPQATYEVWLCNATGLRLASLDSFIELSFARALGNIGRFTLSLLLDSVNERFLQPYYLMQIFRDHDFVFQGIIRKIEYYEKEGVNYVTLSGVDGISLLQSRIVAYKSGSAQASSIGGGDDLMKRIVRENLGGSVTDSTRDLTANHFLVEADSDNNFNMAKKFAWRNVLQVLNEIVDTTLYAAVSTKNQNNATFFDVEPLLIDHNTAGWRFITRRGQLGAHRGLIRSLYPNPTIYYAPQPTIFSREMGNLENTRLSYDYSGEITYVYVGGEGEADKREVEEKSDSGRLNLSPWSRHERFINYSNQESTTALQKRAEQAVAEGRPLIKFSGTPKNTADTRYGTHWNYGDKVAIKFRHMTFDAFISAVRIGVDQNGQESIDSKIEVLL